MQAVARAARIGTKTLTLASRRSASAAMRSVRAFSASASQMSGDSVPVVFIDKDGKETEVQANVGDSLLTIAQENDLDVEGACGGECACSTCHVIMTQEVFDELPEVTEEEEDMLDLAAGLTDTSRLGCQVYVTADMGGLRVQLPTEVSNMMD